ncbi:unnamed protein product [Heligmosomoides polygyrus]|uniref:Tubulin-specific chaperone A n=1 Tax=Heligmosomoides polygyrus TaxID=6339 RepID=A0A183GVN6_HELPZ|nr:unnamed protein product [Heligmosomoides polygyrus]
MSSTLSTRQGLLTRASNRLARILQDSISIREAASFHTTDQNQADKLQRQIRPAQTAIESELRNVEAALENYNVAVDNVNCDDPAIDEILQRVTTHVDATLDLIDKAQDTLTTLSRLSEELKSNQDKNFLTPPPCTPVANLTPLRIPKFDGKI